MSKVFLQLAAGDQALYDSQCEAHETLKQFLTENASAYGLPAMIGELHEEQRETLREAYDSRHVPIRSFPPRPPPPLTYPRLTITLSPLPSLSKTTSNFKSLCTGEAGKQKKAPYKELWYKGCPVHRVETGFVIQGGDVTRGDGSGGVASSLFRAFEDSGGALPLEKAGLKLPFRLGTVAMASSSPSKPGTSQFFIVVTDSPAQLKKLEGKYVVFGQVDEGEGLEGLVRLVDTWGTKAGTVKEGGKVWVEDCGVV